MTFFFVFWWPFCKERQIKITVSTVLQFDLIHGTSLPQSSPSLELFQLDLGSTASMQWASREMLKRVSELIICKGKSEEWEAIKYIDFLY